MKKIFLIGGLISGGVALLLLSLFLILAMQGKLNMQTLSQIPLLGGFFGKPPTIVVQLPKEEKELIEKVEKKPEEIARPMAYINVPSPFTAKQLESIENEMHETIDHYRSKESSLEEKEEQLIRQEKDLKERWEELREFGSNIAVKDEETKEANYQNMAAIYIAMEDSATAAQIMEQQDVVEVSQILFNISMVDPDKAAEIIGSMNPDFAKGVTERIIRLKK